MQDDYGQELILDLRNCNPKTFTRKIIRQYFVAICKKIDMERVQLQWWDDLHTPEGEKETEPHLVGTSAIQFIKTSNITIHTLDKLSAVFINIFSCKSFDAETTMHYTANWFEGSITSFHVIRRQLQ